VDSFNYTAAVVFFILAALVMVVGIIAMDVFEDYLNKKDYDNKEDGGDNDNNRS
jgi:hypothetical protein